MTSQQRANAVMDKLLEPGWQDFESDRATAAIIAAAIDAAVAEEREACAVLADAWVAKDLSNASPIAADNIAADIRARGTT